MKLCDQGGASNNQSGCVTIDGDHNHAPECEVYQKLRAVLKDGSGMYNTQVKNLANFMKAYPNTKVTLMVMQVLGHDDFNQNYHKIVLKPLKLWQIWRQL